MFSSFRPTLLVLAASLSAALLTGCGNLTISDPAACPVGVLSETTGEELKISDNSTGSELAQSFFLDTKMTIKNVSLKLARLGSPQGTLTLMIQSDAPSATPGVGANLPDGTNLATSTLTVTTNSTTQTVSDIATWYKLALVSPDGVAVGTEWPGLILNANTQYWLRLKANYTVWSSTNLIQWMANGTGLFGGGSALVKTSSWEAPTTNGLDFLFEVCTR